MRKTEQKSSRVESKLVLMSQRIDSVKSYKKEFVNW